VYPRKQKFAIKIDEMAEKKLLIDPEYEWIFRTCANAFNVYITMMHFIFYDNTLTLRPENSGKSDTPANLARKENDQTDTTTHCMRIFVKFQKSRFYRTRYS